MIVNIIDNRSNKYNTIVDVIYEPACHDNNIEGATKFIDDCEFDIEEETNIKLVEAIERGIDFNGSVTMYIHDAGAQSITK